jgi:hypothetical protein
VIELGLDFVEFLLFFVLFRCFLCDSVVKFRGFVCDFVVSFADFFAILSFISRFCGSFRGFLCDFVFNFAHFYRFCRLFRDFGVNFAYFCDFVVLISWISLRFRG